MIAFPHFPQLYPDESTLERTFDGVRYADLPYVTIRCSKTNTRFYAHDGDGSQIEYLVPVTLGFINAQKKTNVAAQVTAASLGQKLRNRQGI